MHKGEVNMSMSMYLYKQKNIYNLFLNLLQKQIKYILIYQL